MKTHRVESSGRGTVAAVLVMATTIAACGRRELRDQRAQHDQQLSVADSSQCPSDSASDSYGLLPRIKLSGVKAGIPEFHDCQRFPEGQGYGAVYAIFAAFRLDRASLLGQVRHGPAVGNQLGGKSYGSVAVATIYANGADSALGINRGFNCLFLYTDREAWKQPVTEPVRWQAKMVSLVAKEDCSDSSINVSAGKDLDVRASRDPLFTDADYPDAARWDQDSLGHEYIEIKCGTWCEVGAKGFHATGAYRGPEPTFDSVPGMPATEAMRRRVTVIKGWSDDQWLATVDSSGKVMPSTVHGWLFPNPVLDTLSTLPPDTETPAPGLKYFAKTWVHVASAVLNADYGKWNLTEGENKIYVCHGQAKECNVDTTHSSASPRGTALKDCHGQPTGDPPWWGRIVSRAGTAYMCVRRTDHAKELIKWNAAHHGYKVRIPGGVRWRWLSTDEGGWHACPSGCCKF